MSYTPPEFLEKPLKYFPKKRINNEDKKEKIVLILKKNPKTMAKISKEIKTYEKLTKRLLTELEEENRIYKKKVFGCSQWFFKKPDLYFPKIYLKKADKFKPSYRQQQKSNKRNYSRSHVFKENEIQKKILDMLYIWDLPPTTNQVSKEIKVSVLPTLRILKRMEGRKLVRKETHGGQLKKVTYWYLN